MKKILIKVAAVMALVWYSLGIIGFDVHTCNASGRSFIATFVEGISCEDIHPGHGCGHEHHDCTCGHHHSEETVVSYPQHCCTDDYQALAITGSTSDPSRESGDLSSLCFHCNADYIFAPAPKASVSLERVSLWLDSRFRISCSQALLSVWRIWLRPALPSIRETFGSDTSQNVTEWQRLDTGSFNQSDQKK